MQCVPSSIPPSKRRHTPPITRTNTLATKEVTTTKETTPSRTTPPVTKKTTQLFDQNLERQLKTYTRNGTSATIRLSNETYHQTLTSSNANKLITMLLNNTTGTRLILRRRKANVIRTLRANRNERLNHNISLQTTSVSRRYKTYDRLATHDEFNTSSKTYNRTKFRHLNSRGESSRVLRLLLAVYLRVIKSVQRNSVLSTRTSNRDRTLTLASNATHRQKLPMSMANNMVITMNLLPISSSLTKYRLLKDISLVLNRTTMVYRRRVNLFPRRKTKVVRSRPTRNHTNRYGNRDSTRRRQRGRNTLFLFSTFYQNATTLQAKFFSKREKFRRLFEGFVKRVNMIRRSNQILCVNIGNFRRLDNTLMTIFNPLYRNTLNSLRRPRQRPKDRFPRTPKLVQSLLSNRLRRIVNVRKRVP